MSGVASGTPGIYNVTLEHLTPSFIFCTDILPDAGRIYFMPVTTFATLSWLIVEDTWYFLETCYLIVVVSLRNVVHGIEPFYPFTCFNVFSPKSYFSFHKSKKSV